MDNVFLVALVQTGLWVRVGRQVGFGVGGVYQKPVPCKLMVLSTM